jgi:hypothetical protein
MRQREDAMEGVSRCALAVPQCIPVINCRLEKDDRSIKLVQVVFPVARSVRPWLRIS